MATSPLGLASRRKQPKPQRLHEGPPGSEEMEGLEESSPIDLSTKREKSILEDKSNLLQSLASIATPQQLLSLCAQLAASREVKTEVNDGQNNDVTPPATPRQEVLRCAAMGCGQHFASRGSQLWHLMEEHGTEKLLSCDKCGRRFNDRDQINEHDCDVSFRPVSVGAERAAASSPDADRGSVPAQPGRPFSMIEPEQRATVPSSNLFSQLFAPKPQSMPMVPGPMFPFQMPHFPPTQHHHAPHPFFMRPMEPRSEMFQPRQDSNEDDWEALMEVSTSDEGEKIRALVGDKAMPTTDPNQCILCRRVLSCKSALQMHYRTHTGERPFKCKICQRAFTTKGNLKTHMGVHRAKHSFRGVPMGMGGPMGNHMGGPMGNPMGNPMGGPMSAGHMGGGGQMGGPMQLPNGLQHTQQCPICQKRCVSAMQLQSHMMEHRNSLTGRVPQLPQAPPTNQTNGGFPPGFPFLPFFPSSLRPPNPDQPAPFNLAQLLGKQLVSEEIRVNPEATPTDHNSDCEVRKESRSPPVLALKDIKSEPPQTISSVSPSGSSDASAGSDHSHDQTDGSSVGRCDSDNERKMCLPADSTTTSTNNTDHKPSSESLQTSPSKVENPLEAMQKMWAETEPPPPRQLPVLSKHQCGVCFKHFSSSSALQIHMRTHTGDKPFKCEMCGRAFTTRGNLKVHMGTHVWQQSPSRRGRRIFDSATSSVTSPMKIPTSLGLAMPPPMGLFPPAGLPNMEMMMMLWRTVCSVCQKVCASPSELEQHLKEHLGGSTSRETESPLTSVAD